MNETQTKEPTPRMRVQGLLLRSSDERLLPLCTVDPETEAVARRGIEPDHWRLVIDHERSPGTGPDKTDERRTTARAVFVSPGHRRDQPGRCGLMHTFETVTTTAVEKEFVRQEAAQNAVNALRKRIEEGDGRMPTDDRPAKPERDRDERRRIASAVAAAWYDRRRNARHATEARRRYLKKTVRSLAYKRGFDLDGEARCIDEHDLEEQHLDLKVIGVPPAVLVALENTRTVERCHAEVLPQGDLMLSLPGLPPGQPDHDAGMHPAAGDSPKTGKTGNPADDDTPIAIIVCVKGEIVRVAKTARHRY